MTQFKPMMSLATVMTEITEMTCRISTLRDYPGACEPFSSTPRPSSCSKVESPRRDTFAPYILQLPYSGALFFKSLFLSSHLILLDFVQHFVELRLDLTPWQRHSRKTKSHHIARATTHGSSLTRTSTMYPGSKTSTLVCQVSKDQYHMLTLFRWKKE